jgi:hypothetical protein
MSGKSTNAAITGAGSPREVEDARSKLAIRWRLIFALLLIALEFSNLMQFATFGSNDLFHTSHANVHASPYSLQALGYVMVAVVSVLDPRCLRKLFAQPLFRWTAVTAAVFTWGMLMRAFNPPGGLEEYFFVRKFLLHLNALGFILICMVMFEGELVLRAVKRAVTLITLFVVAVSICEIMHLWIFNGARLGGNRAVGFQIDANAAGVAVVFGCVIGLTAVPRRWRELFILACAAGVITTFSREAMAGLLVVILAAALGRAVVTPRLILLIATSILIFATWNLRALFEDNGVLDKNHIARLEIGTSDASARDRTRLAEKALEQFEEAPLVGNGFGTTTFWNTLESHNLYLSFMADYGILGVLIIPALVWCLAYRSWDFYGFGGAFLIYCMFNHNLFDHPFALISLAIMSSQQASFRSSFRTSTALPAGSLARAMR